MYLENHEKLKIVDREKMQERIPDLDAVCLKCIPFFLKKRSESVKNQDITTGVHFENPFKEFLRGLDIDAFKANKADMRLPDIGVRNYNSDVIALLEVKYHNAPFIKARQFVSPNTEYYDGSLTIDIEKGRNQIKVSKDIFPDAECLLVHWIDFPCLKCILWDTVESALTNTVYERIHRSGDYEGGYKVGYTKKTYHFVRKMKDFDSLISHIQHLTVK